MSIDSGSVRNDESRELRIQRDRERLKAALPTHIGRFLGKLDDSARQRVCNRVAEVLDRYEDYFLSSCLARVIYNTVVQEFLGVPHDADFEAGLVSAHLFTRLALPGSQLTLASSAKELNTHWRNERARIMTDAALPEVDARTSRSSYPHRAAWLKAIMHERDITRNYLYNGLVGPDPATTKRILKGEPVPPRTLDKLAKALKMDRSEVPND